MSLTLTRRTYGRGHRLYDTWEIRNDLHDFVRLVSVEVAGAHTYDDTKGGLCSLPLLVGDDGAESGVSLRFDDDGLQAAIENKDSWLSVSVPPGATMQATVLNNRELRITYAVSDAVETSQIVVNGSA